MKVTDKERHIIKALVAMQKSGKETTGLNELGICLYDHDKLPQPEHWKSALAATLRNLSSKVEREGCRLRRVSKLGRGNAGEYEFKGNFSRLIAQPSKLSPDQIPAA